MGRITKKMFKEGLEQSGGVVSVMAKICNISRQAVYKFLKKNPELKEALHQETERITDIAENNIQKRILSGDIKASTYWLDRKGRDRGFGNVVKIEEDKPSDDNPCKARLKQLKKAKAKLKLKDE